MARGVNKVILVGTLGKDPEVKYMPSGGAIVNISVATSESWKDKNTGEKKEITEWHRVSMFNQLAEIAGKYLSKGQQVYLEGKLKTRKYQKDGSDHYVTEIIADTMQMIGSRQDSGGQSGHAAPQQQQRKSAAKPQQQDAFEDFEDDIPF